MGKSMFFYLAAICKKLKLMSATLSKIFLSMSGGCHSDAPHFYNSDEDLVRLFEAFLFEALPW